MEYMDSGSLTDLIESHHKPFTENQIRYVVSQVAHALNYMHKNHMIHRDIKSDNVMLGSKGEMKLGDFGYAA